MTVPKPQFEPYSPPDALTRRLNRSGAIDGVIARHARELHAMLRRRLLISVAVGVGFFGILPVGSYIAALDPSIPTSSRLALLFQAVVAAILATVGMIIWKRPPFRLRRLRALELVIYGVIVAYLVISNGLFVELYDIMKPPIVPVQHPLLSIGSTRLDAVTLRWMIVVVGYGALIPNTWRRGTTIVLIIVGIHLAELVVQALMHRVTARELFSLMLYPVVWMTVGTVVALFGSYRVSLLERRVQEAERLGQYRLKQFLGAGGMGDVYLAEHVLLKQPFAVKLLRPERILDERVLKRFEAEVQAMARLEHWNTVEIYDYGHAADGSFYYVMEYLPGLTLQQIVSYDGPLSGSRAIRMLLQVCNALNEAHSMGLTHRDIKPGNILVCERAGIYDVAKLLDFGLVKSVEGGNDGLTIEGMVSGTPAFMSPEQAAGSPTIDVRSDIYSLGALGYFLLTARPPFSGRTATETMAAHIYETPLAVSAHRPDVDPRLEAVVMQCLAKKPADRFQTAESVSDALKLCPESGLWTQADAIAWWKAHETDITPAAIA